MAVYVVGYWEYYDDYHVVGVFSERSKAEHCAEVLKGCDHHFHYEIMARNLDPDTVELQDGGDVRCVSLSGEAGLG